LIFWFLAMWSDVRSKPFLFLITGGEARRRGGVQKFDRRFSVTVLRWSCGLDGVGGRYADNSHGVLIVRIFSHSVRVFQGAIFGGICEGWGQGFLCRFCFMLLLKKYAAQKGLRK